MTTPTNPSTTSSDPRGGDPQPPHPPPLRLRRNLPPEENPAPTAPVFVGGRLRISSELYPRRRRLIDVELEAERRRRALSHRYAP